MPEKKPKATKPATGEGKSTPGGGSQPDTGDNEGVTDLRNGAEGDGPEGDEGQEAGLDNEVLDNISPNKELNHAITEQKRSQRQVFESLIDANVRLEHEVARRDETFTQLHSKYEVKCIELQAEKVKSQDLDNKVKVLERENRLLMSTQRHKVGKTGGKSDNMLSDDSDLHVTNNNTDADAVDVEKYETKIQDLQFRLMRLAEDDEDKSRRLAELERELDETKRYTEALENHVPKDVREEVAGGQVVKSEEGFESWGKQTNMVYLGKPEATYTRRQDRETKDSVVCVVS